VFLNDASDKDAEAIVSLLVQMASKREKDGFRAFVYFLDGNASELKALNKKLKADSIALALIPKKDLKETLGLYKINESAKSTVLVYLNREIKAKIVNFDAKKDSEKLKEAINSVCDGK
jgi:hypothetical protein